MLFFKKNLWQNLEAVFIFIRSIAGIAFKTWILNLLFILSFYSCNSFAIYIVDWVNSQTHNPYQPTFGYNRTKL